MTDKDQDKQKPERLTAKDKSRISASIFTNETTDKDGKTTTHTNVQIQASYFDKKANAWKYNSSFSANELDEVKDLIDAVQQRLKENEKSAPKKLKPPTKDKQADQQMEA